MGALTMRALLFWVSVCASVFWKLPSETLREKAPAQTDWGFPNQSRPTSDVAKYPEVEHQDGLRTPAQVKTHLKQAPPTEASICQVILSMRILFCEQHEIPVEQQGSYSGILYTRLKEFSVLL